MKSLDQNSLEHSTGFWLALHPKRGSVIDHALSRSVPSSCETFALLRLFLASKRERVFCLHSSSIYLSSVGCGAKTVSWISLPLVEIKSLGLEQLNSIHCPSIIFFQASTPGIGTRFPPFTFNTNSPSGVFTSKSSPLMAKPFSSKTKARSSFQSKELMSNSASTNQRIIQWCVRAWIKMCYKL